MKKALLFLFTFCSVISYAQITLEHTYFYTEGVQRIVLENSGEKYYSVNYQTGIIQFYNADHSPWKNVMISLPSGNYSLGIYHISEAKIDPDDNLEIVYSTYSSPGFRQSRIINELGTVLLSVDNCESLSLNKIEGLSDKIISSSGTVYTIPGLLAEHTYPQGFVRVNLENSGEKYYVTDVDNSLVDLYNADHSFWKSIALPKPEGYSLGGVSLLSENQVNSDNLIEVGYSFYINGSNPVTQSRIINENGVVLLTAVNSGVYRLSYIEGASNKLMVDYEIGEWPENYNRTDVYSVPDFNLEHTYQGPIQRIKLENSEEKYYATSYNPGITAITIYNNDHTLWKTIATPIESEWGANIRSVFISQTKFDPDDKLEIVYTISSNTLDGGHYYSYIVKDDGTIVLDLPNAYGVYLSEFPNLAKKVMLYSQDGPSFDQLYYTTSVYAIDGTFGRNDFKNEAVNIFPNPATSVINLTTNTKIIEASIYSMTGTLVKIEQSNNITKMNVGELPTGMYLLNLTDSSHFKSTQKIIISH